MALFICHISIAKTKVFVVTDPTMPALSNLFVCDNDNDGFSTFDLTVQDAPILAAQSGTASNYSISYYETLSNANVGANAISNPTDYYNINSFTQNIYVRIRNVNTNAFVVASFQIIVNQASYASGPHTFINCDSYSSPYDGVDQIDLTQFKTAILNGQNPSVFLVSYYTSLSDALTSTNALTIAESQAYVMDSADTDTIWVKVENSSNSITPFCYAITTINIIVERYPNPIINTVNDVNAICVNYLNSSVLRDLTLDSGIPNPSAYSFDWYETSDPTTIIGSSATYTVDTPSFTGSTRNYVVHVTSNSLLGCDTTSTSFAVIQSGPALISSSSSGYSIINLSGVQSIIVSIVGYGTYEYSLDNGPRQTSNVFENVSLGSHSITVFDTEGGTLYSCDSLTINNILIETSQVAAPTGITLQNFTAGATLANLAVTGSNIQWYASATSTTPLPLNTVLVSGTTYYATQTVGGVQSVARLAVTVQVTLGVSTTEILTLQYAPNPVKNVLTLQSNTILKLVVVYNLLGQKVIEQVVNDSNTTVDFSFLPSGNYMLKVQGESAQKVIKILKQ